MLLGFSVMEKTCGIGKRQVALGNAEEKGLFSNGAGSAESVPKPEHGPLFLVSFIQHRLPGFKTLSCKWP